MTHPSHMTGIRVTDPIHGQELRAYFTLQYERKKQKKDLYLVQCHNCGKWFDTRDRRRRYCSQVCFQIFTKKEKKRRKQHMRRISRSGELRYQKRGHL